jgi:hypothetical protein
LKAAGVRCARRLPDYDLAVQEGSARERLSRLNEFGEQRPETACGAIERLNLRAATAPEEAMEAIELRLMSPACCRGQPLFQVRQYLHKCLAKHGASE